MKRNEAIVTNMLVQERRHIVWPKKGEGYDSGMDMRLSCHKLSIVITEQWLNNV